MQSCISVKKPLSKKNIRTTLNFTQEYNYPNFEEEIFMHDCNQKYASKVVQN